MAIPPEDLGVMIPIVALCIPIVKIWTNHLEKIAQMRLEARSVSANVATVESSGALEDLRAEVAALRETSTHFDMSFDAAISRLEQRVAHLEGQGTTLAAETAPPAVYSTATVTPAAGEAPAVLRAGSGR